MEWVEWPHVSMSVYPNGDISAFACNFHLNWLLALCQYAIRQMYANSMQLDSAMEWEWVCAGKMNELVAIRHDIVCECGCSNGSLMSDSIEYSSASPLFSPFFLCKWQKRYGIPHVSDWMTAAEYPFQLVALRRFFMIPFFSGAYFFTARCFIHELTKSFAKSPNEVQKKRHANADMMEISETW